MPESERHPDIDTFLVQKAEELANRLLLIQTTHHTYGIKNGHFRLREFLAYDGKKEAVDFEYFLDARTPQLSTDEKLHILFARQEIDFPLLSIEIKHDGKYHSTVGDIPGESYARNGLIYQASNRFVFSQKGKAYRVDTLVESKRHYLDEEVEFIPFMESDPPKEEDLGTRINPLQPEDFEQVDMYLDYLETYHL